MSHDAGATCACVSEHRPAPDELHIHHIWPLGWGGPDTAWNRVWLCPTSHANVHVLLAAYQKAGGMPAWEVRRRFSPYVRGLADEGWRRLQASR